MLQFCSVLFTTGFKLSMVGVEDHVHIQSLKEMMMSQQKNVQQFIGRLTGLHQIG